MSEGRTDPQRRWTIYVCPQCGGIGGGVEGGVICSCAGAVEQVVVVPADDQLTEEEWRAVVDALNAALDCADYAEGGEPYVAWESALSKAQSALAFSTTEEQADA